MRTNNGDRITVLVGTQDRDISTSDKVLVERQPEQLVNRARKTEPDFVLVDLSLPGLEAPRLVEALTRVAPTAELILTHEIHRRLSQILARRRRRRQRRSAAEALEAILKQMDLSPRELRDLAKEIGASSRLSTEPVKDSWTVAESIAGPLPEPRERARLELEALKRYFEERRHLLQGSLATSQVAELLGTSRQTPHDRVRARTLLAVSDGGRLLFPSWQFDPNGPDGVIEGLPETLAALRVGALSAVRWLTRPNPILERRTPIEALRSGDIDRVVAEAAGVGSD
jgi:hypothetical protein